MILEVAHLKKHFGNFVAVDDLSFSVRQGEVYGFLGQNGAGKSTTIRMLLSLITPTSGTIQLFGQSITQHREAILNQMGAVVEKPDLYKYLTGFENLTLFAKMSGKTISKNDINATLALVGLDKRCHDPVRVYSQGMKQRLGIAVALVHDPAFIILDEPTNGLDPQGIADIRNLILLLSKERGKTVLVSSHLLSEIEQVADSMLIINRGKKIVEGKVNELLNPNQVRLEITVDEHEKAKQLIQESPWGARMQYAPDGKLIVETEAQAVGYLNKLLVEHQLNVTSLRSMNSLEAYFLSLTAGHEV